MKYNISVMGSLSILLLMGACAQNAPKDYDASARCQEMGNAPGTTGYTQCMKNARMEKLMQQQRQEFEQFKQQEQDDKMRRY